MYDGPLMTRLITRGHCRGRCDTPINHTDHETGPGYQLWASIEISSNTGLHIL